MNFFSKIGKKVTEILLGTVTLIMGRYQPIASDGPYQSRFALERTDSKGWYLSGKAGGKLTGKDWRQRRKPSTDSKTFCAMCMPK